MATMKSALSIVASLAFCLCSPPLRRNAVLIHENYEGIVLIVFDASSIQHHSSDSTITFRIDSTGVLRGQQYDERKTAAFTFCYYDSAGGRDSIPYLNPLTYTNNFEEYNQSTRVAASFMENGSYLDSLEVKHHYLSFVVGRMCDLDSLVETRSTFLLRNLYHQH